MNLGFSVTAFGVPSIILRFLKRIGKRLLEQKLYLLIQ